METGDIHFHLMSFAFIIGFILQGALIALSQKNKRRYIFTALSALAAYLILAFLLKDKSGFSIVLPMMIMLLLMVRLFKDTLPAIGTQTVLLYTIFFWFIWHEAYYRFISTFLTPTTWSSFTGILMSANISSLAILPLFSAVAITPIISTICIIQMAYTKIPLNYNRKLISFVWFLLIAVLLMVTQFPSDLNSPRIKTSASQVDIFLKFMEVAISGMFILQLAFYSTIILYFTPREDEKREEWKKRVRLLVNKFSDLRLKPTWSFALCLTQVTLLVTNNFLQIIPNNSMIALLAILSMQPITGREKDDARIMNDLENQTNKEDYQEAAEQKQTEADREKLKEIVSKERLRIEGHN